MAYESVLTSAAGADKDEDETMDDDDEHGDSGVTSTTSTDTEDDHSTVERALAFCDGLSVAQNDVLVPLFNQARLAQIAIDEAKRKAKRKAGELTPFLELGERIHDLKKALRTEKLDVKSSFKAMDLAYGQATHAEQVYSFIERVADPRFTESGFLFSDLRLIREAHLRVERGRLADERYEELLTALQDGMSVAEARREFLQNAKTGAKEVLRFAKARDEAGATAAWKKCTTAEREMLVAHADALQQELSILKTLSAVAKKKAEKAA